jgi:hypothetical protein
VVRRMPDGGRSRVAGFAFVDSRLQLARPPSIPSLLAVPGRVAGFRVGGTFTGRRSRSGGTFDPAGTSTRLAAHGYVGANLTAASGSWSNVGTAKGGPGAHGGRSLGPCVVKIQIPFYHSMIPEEELLCADGFTESSRISDGQ